MRLDYISGDWFGSKRFYLMRLDKTIWEWTNWSDYFRWNQIISDEIKSDRIGSGELIWDYMRFRQTVSYKIRWPEITDEIRKDQIGPHKFKWDYIS